MKASIFLLAVSTFILLSGCSSVDPVTKREHLGYFPARGYDLMDMFELNLGVDSEVSLYAAGAVEPVVVGGGLFSCEKVGIDGRLFGHWKEQKAMIGLGPEAFVRYEKTPLHGNHYLKDEAYKPLKNTVSGEDSNLFYVKWGMTQRLFDHERRLLDVTAELHLIALGVNVGISPVETLDFITGLFGIDVISDDDWVAPRPDRRVPLFGEEKPAPAASGEAGGRSGKGGEEAVIHVEENQG